MRPAHAVTSLVVATVVLASACGGKREALGGGGDVDVCTGYAAYDRLPEPDPSSAPQVLEWSAAVLRVIERTQTKDEVRNKDDKRQPVPAEVADALGALRSSVEQLRERVRTAAREGPEAVRRATDALALDPEFAAADRTLGRFHTTVCR